MKWTSPRWTFVQLQNNCFCAPSHSSFQHLRNICSLLYCCFPNLRAPPFLVPVQHEHGQSSAVLRLIPVIITNIPSCISPLPISAFCSLHLKSELKVRIVFFFVLGLDDNFSSQQWETTVLQIYQWARSIRSILSGQQRWITVKSLLVLKVTM